MKSRVIGYYQRLVEKLTAKSQFKKYFDSVKLECIFGNLTPKLLKAILNGWVTCWNI
jgi:hypothetical protein